LAVEASAERRAESTDERLQAPLAPRHDPEIQAQKDAAAVPGPDWAAGLVYQRAGVDRAVALAAGDAVALNAPARSAALSFALHAAARSSVALQDQPASEAE